MVRIGGIVLCGGQSKRMGTPKAWLPIAGELMLPRIVRLMSEVVTPIVVVTAAGQDLPPLPAHVRTVYDQEDGRGPLQGLAEGLSALTGLVDAAYVSSCDAPLLKPAFVRRMIDQLGEHQIIIPLIDGQHHPLAAVYRVDVLTTVHALLAANRRRLLDLIEHASTHFVGEGDLRDVDATFESLRNVNTPSELARVVHDLTNLDRLK